MRSILIELRNVASAGNSFTTYRALQLAMPHALAYVSELACEPRARSGRLGMNVVLILVGGALSLASFLPFALAYEMVAHPAGVGMEWIAVPLVGIIGIALLAAGLTLITVGRRLHSPHDMS